MRLPLSGGKTESWGDGNCSCETVPVVHGGPGGSRREEIPLETGVVRRRMCRRRRRVVVEGNIAATWNGLAAGSHRTQVPVSSDLVVLQPLGWELVSSIRPRIALTIACSACSVDGSRIAGRRGARNI